MKTGVYWGRFNPPHKGHISLIENLLKKVDKLIIAIGSSKEKNTKRNPFNGKERKLMLVSYLKERKINLDKVKIIEVPDGKSYESSVKNLLKLIPKFDVLFTDKKTIINLIEKKVEIQCIKRRGAISSTRIRDAIASNNKWEQLTGKSVAFLVKKLNGIKRIKRAYNKLK
jgi:nicotinamide-nucleotide adenylyltransferase